MKNFRLSALLCCVSLCGFAACSDDKTDDQPEPQAYQVTQFESSTIPASIPGEGGGYKLTFVIRTETRSTGATFEPWAYRLTLGDAVGDAVTVTKPTTEIAITIPPNRSKEERGVAVEMASGVKAETWTKIVEATQEGSLKDYQVTKFESTTIPATIPAGGGDYDVLFRLEVETRAAAPLFVAWQYRVTLGDAVGDAVEVTEPTEKIGIHIDASESVEERAVIVEMAEVAETPVWTKIVEATQEAGRKEYEVTEFESTTIPASVPFAGGDYEVKFRTKIETRATPQFEPWQYRLTVGEAVGEPVVVDEPTESVAVHIGANYSEKEVDVIFETAAASQTPVWTKVVEAKQQAGMELLGGFYWTKSNVSVKNDRFVLADKPSDSGLFFRHESGYGVPSDEATYAGTAYTPAPVQIAIDAIPQNEGVDPCSLIDPALRMPTYAELSELYYGEDVQRTQDGVTGMGYTGVSLFLPYCGVMSTETGTSVGKSTFGGYWGLGGDFHGNGVIYSLNGEIGYSLLDYDAVGTNMAMVRCVRNVPQPKYVMHTLPETVDYKAFSLNVETDPGAFTYYDVTVWGDDGTLTQTGATDARPQVSVGIPKNDTKQDRTLRLFVNHIYTGVEFVQPAMTDYALYVSHTPASAEYGAFTLSVTCDSDMASFPVVVKGSDGGEWSGTGSKENPTVEIAIPENTGEERTLSIWVNGVDTKKTVKQGKQVVPLVYSVVWSEGYLTVRDGAYVFAAPKERGMYFKYKSQYGFALPDPDKSLSRRNNRKISFDAACRKILFEIAKRHGLELEEEAEYGNRKYLEKQDFILAKQKEQLAAQQNKLDKLTLKVSDMETLLEDVSAAAYDKAVEVVTDVVRTETRKEDMRMIEDTKKWVLSPERKAPQTTREYAAHRLDTVLDKFLKTMQTTAARLQEKLLKPEVRQKGKEQVKEKARDSVLQLLNRLQAEQAQNKPAAQPRTQEGHSEI